MRQEATSEELSISAYPGHGYVMGTVSECDDPSAPDQACELYAELTGSQRRFLTPEGHMTLSAL